MKSLFGWNVWQIGIVSIILLNKIGTHFNIIRSKNQMINDMQSVNNKIETTIRKKEEENFFFQIPDWIKSLTIKLYE